nr:Uncharacterised protein [Enterobacter mori]
MKWRYSLRWKRPGEPELASEVVEAGKPAPESVMSLWVAGAGYAVCVDFLCDRQIGVLRRNRRNFRYPNFSPATSVSKSIISLLLWKV